MRGINHKRPFKKSKQKRLKGKRLLKVYPSFKVFDGVRVYKSTFYHHRKPASAGGERNEKNMSYVDPYRHTMFHFFAGNLHPARLTVRLNRMLSKMFKKKNYHIECEKSDGKYVSPRRNYKYLKMKGGKYLNLKCGLQIGMDKLERRLFYLNLFMNNITVREFIYELNEKWIDPDFKLILYVKDTKKSKRKRGLFLLELQRTLKGLP